MAAGSGSRYGKLKQFDELGPKDEFLMEFSIFDAIENGFDHIVIITKAANQEFLQNYLSERLPKHIKLDVLIQDVNDLPKGVTLNTERIKPWGTAHAVWTARNIINTDFVIINADDYYGKPAFVGASNFVKNNNSNTTYAIVGYNLKDTLSEHGSVSRGVCLENDGTLVSIEEHTKIQEVSGNIFDEDSNKNLDPDTIVSMNFWICNPMIFDYIETYFSDFLNVPENLEKSEIYLPFVAQEMMANGLIDINVIPSNSNWFGVTYYDDKNEAVKTLAELTTNNKYPSPLWNS
ncbi:UTP--glucose-1-phosphate uridylyltransferase [Flavobacteriaceae bacterium AU392]|nr:UTP--glucose-1-phosphate uridylyltransferase [Flavobacteriaceae bacterium]RKM82943.1 UTP--glucose-1-phosphate uridylyltransferase [Flavobacteriaceae bacterium AU392]